MINLALSLAAGLAVATAVRLGTAFGWTGAVVPGAVVAVAAYLLLARWTMKQLEALFEAASKEIRSQHFEKAIQLLESGFAHAPWQFLVGAQLHSQLGILHYARKEFDEALPHLEKSFSRHGLARAMLAAQRWRTRDVAGATRVLDAAVRTSKKEGLIWCVYAWMLEKEGRHDEAVKVLGRATAANPTDAKLKAAFQALQNDKKLKLGKLYEGEWYQFHLEAIPPQVMGGGMVPRGGKRALYGRR
jgi:tetratricopeptide (TPR) repeat protein